MLKIIIQDPRYISPFNERARDLRIQNKPIGVAEYRLTKELPEKLKVDMCERKNQGH